MSLARGSGVSDCTKPAAIDQNDREQSPTASVISPESTILTQQIIHNTLHHIDTNSRNPWTTKRSDSPSKAVISPSTTNTTFDTILNIKVSSLNSHGSSSHERDNNDNNIESTPKRMGNGASDGILGISPPQYHSLNNNNTEEEAKTTK